VNRNGTTANLSFSATGIFNVFRIDFRNG